MAEHVSHVGVQRDTLTVNKTANPITFATDEAVIANVVGGRHPRAVDAFRFGFLESGGMTITYNQVNPETADWCSDTWGVLLVRD